MFTFTTQFRAGEKSTGAGDKITALNSATMLDFKLLWYAQWERVQIKIVVVAEKKLACTQEIRRSELQGFARARHAPGTNMRVVPR